VTSRILLTGATGFFGRKLLKSISSLGIEVDILVRAGKKIPFSSGDLVSNVIEISNLFIQDPLWYESLCKNYTTVIHLAWHIEPGNYQSNTNIESLIGSLSLAYGARKAGVKKFVSIGTCLEYEMSSEKLSVKNTPLRPTTLYGASKLSFYYVLSQLFNAQENNFLWCRLFYLLPNKNDEILPGKNRSLAHYIRSNLSKNEFVSLTSGSQVKDYLYVSDAADMVAKAIFQNKIGAINICSGIPKTVREIAEEISFEYGKPELLKFGELPQQENISDYIVGEKDPFFSLNGN
jgi:dTDP-6-deoxy-L-talose 4-dehydrogenase (NAD+)